MSRIWSMMDIGKRSMMNSQTALQTTSHNIANKNTEGYSRQRVEMQANVPTGMGKLRIGNGARASEITRTNNSYLEKQIEKETGVLGKAEARTETYGRVEQVFNEQINKGLNKFMAEFFNSLRELSNQPESLATRSAVKDSADFLAKDFHRVNNQLTEIQRDIDLQVRTHVEAINQMTREIAQLNESIQKVEIGGRPANDERDRRDLLLKKLGEKINIRYSIADAGAVVVSAGTTAVLVSGGSSRDLVVQSTPANKDGKREGNVEIFYKPTEESTAVNITQQISGGALGGVLAMRDSTINGLLKRLDVMAYTLANAINEAHALGYDRYGKTGNMFFESMKGVDGASEKISVSAGVGSDVGKIAAGAQPNSPGDNRVANVMAALQYEKVASEGTATVDDFYNTIVGQVGIEANRAKNDFQTQSDTVKQLANIRESISGVSLDEETTKMIEFQKAFDASARMIRTADEMMDTVLNLKKM